MHPAADAHDSPVAGGTTRTVARAVTRRARGAAIRNGSLTPGSEHTEPGLGAPVALRDPPLALVPRIVGPARTPAAVEALRPLWTSLRAPSPASDIDVFLESGRYDSTVLNPHVFAIGEDGAPTLVAAQLVDRGWTYRTRFGGAIWAPRLRVLEVVRGGFVGASDPESLAQALRQLRAVLRSGGADAIVLHSVERGSPLWTHVMEEVPRALRRTRAYPLARRLLDVSVPLDEILRGRPARVARNLRRCVRRAERELGDAVELRVLTRPEDAGAFLAHVAAVTPWSARAEHLQPLLDDPLERRLVEFGLERGWYRAYTLSVHGHPAAFWSGFLYGGVFGWRGRTGFDARLSSHGAGMLALVGMLEHLCADPHVHTLDFGVGDHGYKRALTDHVVHEDAVRIFGTSSKAIAVNATELSINRARRGLSLLRGS